jgi:putative PIG3 family NAD(P)H quinone oxidoreductase
MKAIQVKGTSNGQPTLVWDDYPDPTSAEDEVLVRVHASAINRADLSQAAGNYPPPPGASEILGLEMAGAIVAVGPRVEEWQVGDRVCALLPGGGYAELATVPAGMLMPIPDEWSYVQAAAIPEAWFTAYVNLFEEGKLIEGQSVLIHAGGSGVGTAAVQLARLTGCRVFVTAGTEEKLATCRELGAEVAVNYKEQDWLPPVLEATGQEGVNVILDPVGANYLERNLRALTRFGRLVSIGLLSGAKAELDMSLILRNRLTIVGSTLRTRPGIEKEQITRNFTETFWPPLRKGLLKPIIDRTFPMQDAGMAHDYVRQDQNIGKVILVAG